MRKEPKKRLCDEEGGVSDTLLFSRAASGTCFEDEGYVGPKKWEISGISWGVRVGVGATTTKRNDEGARMIKV